MSSRDEHYAQLHRLQCHYGPSCKFWETGEEHIWCEPREGLRELWKEVPDPCKCGAIRHVGYWNNQCLWKELLHTREACNPADLPDRDWKRLAMLAMMPASRTK